MVPMDGIRVLIADDHTLMRAMLRLVLDREADIKVVGEARDGRQALELAHCTQPHVVLADVNMPPPDGLLLARLLCLQLPGTRTIIVTAHEDVDIAREARSAGAMGCLTKQDLANDLPRAIRTVVSGRFYLDESFSENGCCQLAGAPALPWQP